MGRESVTVQGGVARDGDRGRQAMAVVLQLCRLLPIAPMSGALPRGAIAPATPPDSWYTRGALS
jgi:hypothetical protein